MTWNPRTQFNIHLKLLIKISTVLKYTDKRLVQSKQETAQDSKIHFLITRFGFKWREIVRIIRGNDSWGCWPITLDVCHRPTGSSDKCYLCWVTIPSSTNNLLNDCHSVLKTWDSLVHLIINSSRQPRQHCVSSKYTSSQLDIRYGFNVNGSRMLLPNSIID